MNFIHPICTQMSRLPCLTFFKVRVVIYIYIGRLVGQLLSLPSNGSDQWIGQTDPLHSRSYICNHGVVGSLTLLKEELYFIFAALYSEGKVYLTEPDYSLPYSQQKNTSFVRITKVKQEVGPYLFKDYVEPAANSQPLACRKQALNYMFM